MSCSNIQQNTVNDLFKVKDRGRYAKFILFKIKQFYHMTSLFSSG